MIYEFLFEDGSRFAVPEDWREVYERRLKRVDAAEFEARLRFLIGKYLEHRATPSTYDGMVCPIEGDARFDDQRFYFDTWDNPWNEGSFRAEAPPSVAAMAERVLYHILRPELLQQALDRLSAERSQTPPRVMTAEEFVREFGQEEGTAGE